MDIIGPIIFYGSIWVVLTWRCFAVTSICTEVAEGKTTKDALLFQLLQTGILFFLVFTLFRIGMKSISQFITAASLLITGIWYVYSIVKAGLQLRNNKQNQRLEPTPDGAAHP